MMTWLELISILRKPTGGLPERPLRDICVNRSLLCINNKKSFDLDMIKDINRLWLPVCPGLARQAADVCVNRPKRVLELGCFSGGTGLELLKIFPEAERTIAMDMPELISSFQRGWCCTDENRVRLQEVSLNKPSLLAEKYDLVFCRGAFFFLEPDAEIVREMLRLLAEGSPAFFGGGYGKYIPEQVIAEIADESRIKNNALGRKVYTVEEIREFLKRSGIADRSETIEEGDLWVLMRN